MVRDTYNWQRFWCLLGGNVRLSDEGFLYNPGPYNSEIVSFNEIANIPCLALLGEPGIGKSRTIEAETDALRRGFDREADRVFLFDLRSYRSEGRLVRSLFESSEFTEWRAGSHRLHLFLDSLDECLLRIETVAGLLVEELKKYPVDRLFLRVACRTAEWPNLLSIGMRETWGADQFKLYELAQLRRDDVVNAARIKGLPVVSFLQELEIRGAGPLAAKPITLRFLLDLFEKHNRLPGTKGELYENGCRILCEEMNESRLASGLRGNLNSVEKMVVAARVAAVMTLANRAAVWTGSEFGDVAAEDVAIRDLVGWHEETKGQSFQVTEKSVKETLSTGLFTARGEHRLGWAHQTYAEYLAAWYLRHIGLDHKQALHLLTHQGTAEQRLVPQLHETAAWAASLIPKLFDDILPMDPDVLLSSDVGSVNPRYRERLVAALLKLFEDEKSSDDLRLRSQYKHLDHPSLAEQLRPYIVDSSKGWLVRRVATDIAEECKKRELQEVFVQIALDGSEEITMRAQAASAICDIADRKIKARLKDLAITGDANDSNQELKGYALTAAWPDNLSAEDLFAAIIEPRESYLGSYQLFLSHHLVQGLQTADLETALEWVATQEKTGLSLSLGSVADAIMIFAWEHLDNEEIIERFTTAAWSKITRHQDLLGARGFRPTPESMMVFMADDNKRRRVLLAMLRQVTEPEKDWLWFLRSQALRVFDFDLEWLINQLPTITSTASRQTVFHILQRFFVNEVKPELLGALVEVRDANETLREELQPLFLINLGSPEAELSRRNFELIEEYSRQEVEESPLLQPSPSERVETLLKRFENGEIEVWWWLNKELTLEPRSTHYSTSHDADLTTLPGWLAADETVRNRLVAAAREYIQVGEPKNSEWFGTNKLYEPAIAGYRALLLVLMDEPGFLDSLSNEVWRKWIPIIVSYPRTMGVDDKKEAQHRALITAAYRNAPTILIEDLLSLLENANATNEPFSISRAYDGCWDEQFGAAFIDKVKDLTLKPNLVSHLLDRLLEKDVKGAREFAESLITSPVPKGGEARDRAIIGARELMAYSPDAGWPIVWPAMQSDSEFGRAISESLEYVLRASRGTLFSKLSDENLADYYIWLSNQYPHNEDPSYEGMHMVGPRESIAQWRDSLLTYLKERGTPSSVAAVKKISKSLPHLDWMKWVLIDARKRTLMHTWTPLEPTNVVSYLINQRVSKKPMLQALLENPLFLGALTLSGFALGFIGLALAFAPIPSTIAAIVCLAIGWLISVAAVYTFVRVFKRPSRQRIAMTSIFGLLSLGTLLLFSWWLMQQGESNLDQRINEKPALQMPEVSPTPTRLDQSETPSSTPTPQRSPNRRKR